MHQQYLPINTVILVISTSRKSWPTIRRPKTTNSWNNSGIIYKTSDSLGSTHTSKMLNQRNVFNTYNRRTEIKFIMTSKYVKKILSSIYCNMPYNSPTTSKTAYQTSNMGQTQLRNSLDFQYIPSSGNTIPFVTRYIPFRTYFNQAEEFPSGIQRQEFSYISVIQQGTLYQNSLGHHEWSQFPLCSVVFSVSFLNYEVERIGTEFLQPGFQPWTGAKPALDSGCPTQII